MANENEKEEQTKEMTSEEVSEWQEAYHTFITEHKKALSKESDILADAFDDLESGLSRMAKRLNIAQIYKKRILGLGETFRDLGYADLWPSRRGIASTLPDFVQKSIALIKRETEAAFTDFWVNNPTVQHTEIISGQNKELGGLPYQNGEQYGKGHARSAGARFTKMFNEGHWDGNYENLPMNITQPIREETSETEDTPDES